MLPHRIISRYAFAYGMAASVPPKSTRSSSRNASPIIWKVKMKSRNIARDCPSIWLASLYFFSPRKRETIAEEPWPTIMPHAVSMTMKGIVNPIPAIGSAAS